MTVADLGSKNGTRVDGRKIGGEPVELRDGATLTLGDIAMRFHDPAERQLRGDPPSTPTRKRTAPPAIPPSQWPFIAFTAITVLALVALIWILAT